MYIYHMRYRLKENGQDSVLAFMQARHKTISWLSDQTNISRPQVRTILKGRTNRSHPENLEAIGKALKLEIDYDDEGIFFQEPVVSDKEVLDKETRQLIETLSEKTPSERKRIMNIIRALLDNLK